MTTWQWALLGVLFLAGALLTLGALPRNHRVGLRTARTLGAADAWRRAHRELGLVTLGLAAAALLLQAWPLHPLFQALAAMFVMIGAAGLYAVVHRRYAS